MRRCDFPALWHVLLCLWFFGRVGHRRMYFLCVTQHLVLGRRRVFRLQHPSRRLNGPALASTCGHGAPRLRPLLAEQRELSQFACTNIFREPAVCRWSHALPQAARGNQVVSCRCPPRDHVAAAYKEFVPTLALIALSLHQIKRKFGVHTFRKDLHRHALSIKAVSRERLHARYSKGPKCSGRRSRAATCRWAAVPGDRHRR